MLGGGGGGGGLTPWFPGSAAAGQLVVPFSKTKTLGDKGFVISGPSTWNILSSELHDQTMSLFSFKKHLKTFLFQTQ